MAGNQFVPFFQVYLVYLSTFFIFFIITHSMSFTGGQATGDTSSPTTVIGGAGSNDGEDIMSAFNDQDPFGKKFESSVNLGDTTSTAYASSPSSSATTNDLTSLTGLKGGAGTTSEIDKLLNSGYSLGLPSSDDSTSSILGGSNTPGLKNVHHIGDTKEGIGSKVENVQGKSITFFERICLFFL